MPGPFVSAVPAAAGGARLALQKLLSMLGSAGRGTMNAAGKLPGLKNLENVPPEIRQQLIHRQLLQRAGQAAQPAVDMGRRAAGAAGRATQRPRAFLGRHPTASNIGLSVGAGYGGTKLASGGDMSPEEELLQMLLGEQEGYYF